jgi:hypothetical protein
MWAKQRYDYGKGYRKAMESIKANRAWNTDKILELEKKHQDSVLQDKLMKAKRETRENMNSHKVNIVAEQVKMNTMALLSGQKFIQGENPYKCNDQSWDYWNNWRN